MEAPTFMEYIMDIVFSFEDLYRFHSKISVKSDDECWIWMASIGTTGYGRFSIKHKWYKAHVIAYRLATGKWPENELVMHTCDNTLCVNPKHLVDATYFENNFDSICKGRRLMPHKPGESNGNAKLTVQDVLEIRRLAKETTLTYTEIGIQYHVQAPAIYKIVNKLTWKHI